MIRFSTILSTCPVESSSFSRENSARPSRLLEPRPPDPGTVNSMHSQPLNVTAPFRLAILTVMAICLLALLDTATLAEGQSEKDDFQPLTPDDFQPARHGLAERPLIAQPLGLAMYVPDSQLVTDRADGQLVVSLHDPSDPPEWTITLQHMHTDRGATPRGQIEQHLAALAESGQEHQVIANQSVTPGNAEGHLCYLQQVSGSGRDAEPYISGWLILRASPDAFLVFSILSTPEAFPLLRTALDAGFETINLRSVAELSLERRSRIDAGRAFLESITPERLLPLMDTRQWARLYRIDSEGREIEVGYSLLEVFEAKRGELHPGRRESEYTSTEREEGIMVKLQGRIIGDLDRGIFFDSIAMYWMAWDQSEEAWSVRGTQRQGQAERSESETGLRIAPSTGNPRPTLTVIRQRSSDYQRTPAEWSVPDAYLSQALGSVLGRLLPRDEQRRREFSYYFYNYTQATPQLTQRTDQWEPHDNGQWRLTTHLNVDSPPIVSIYTADGEFVRTRRPDGTITEPARIEDIRRLWQRRGLPMGQ